MYEQNYALPEFLLGVPEGRNVASLVQRSITTEWTVTWDID